MEDEKDLTPQERMQWLRDRGILIETPEERKAQASAASTSPSSPRDLLTYVLVPADTTLPLQELVFESSQEGSGDALLDHLKPAFAKHSQNVDLGLLQHSAPLQAGSTAPENVSENTLKEVAKQGHVEVFNLVHPTPSNKFVGINIYLDEIGMLKRLPLNKRASDYAKEAGYNPPPQFYGDVYLGRTQRRGPVAKNMAFPLSDANPAADWLKQAAIQNLEYQTEMNQITGRKDTQVDVAGSNGIASNADGYSWTQTEEELELLAVLPSTDIHLKDLKVKFKPRYIEIVYQSDTLVSFELFEKVDVDGCTWTIDRSKEKPTIVVTMEKVDEAFWPRIMN
eukprot:scaffold6638_cov127-Cylindrotheca_fusiformis.AAC.22